MPLWMKPTLAYDQGDIEIVTSLNEGHNIFLIMDNDYF